MVDISQTTLMLKPLRVIYQYTHVDAYVSTCGINTSLVSVHCNWRGYHIQTWLVCIEAFLVNTALALGTEEILLGTFLMSRNELECKLNSENAIHDFLMAFLLAMEQSC